MRQEVSGHPAFAGAYPIRRPAPVPDGIFGRDSRASGRIPQETGIVDKPEMHRQWFPGHLIEAHAAKAEA
jgi:hypothetical protein